MRDRRKAVARKAWVALAMMLSLVGAVLGQAQRPGGACSSAQPGRSAPEKGPPRGGRPAGKGCRSGQRPASGFTHYTLRLRSFDGTPLAASYYPSRLGSSAPVVMLVHELGRSRKDFEDGVQELKGQGLAEHLQELGYAVFSMDLRWQGQNPRRALVPTNDRN